MRLDIKKNTDQLNYEDFLGGLVRVVTIISVEKGRKEAQYDIAIEGDDRYWRPPPTVLKLLIKAWGDEAAQWAGRRVELYGDPNVDSPAMKKAGGIRVSRVSHIDAPVSEMLTITRGKKARFTLDPLPDVALTPSTPANPERDALLAQIKDAAATAQVGLDTIAAEWAESHDGQNIKDATDIGGLELVRDDLIGRAS